MSDADDAYKEAQRLIAEAKASGATELDFSTPKTRALTALPPELSNLTGLTTLNLMDTQVTDLTPVIPLTALATLILHGTRVTDLSPITNIAALTELYLSRTQVTDLTALTHITALTKLYFSSTKVTDLAPLNQLAAVTALGLGSTEVTDLTPLAQMTSLTNLGLSNTLVTDLSPLTQLTGIVTLHLSGTPVTDLAPLSRLTALTTLELNGTLVTDPRPLAALTKLATSPRFDGLTFTDTPFAAMPEFVGIAEIEDPAERAQQLFAALEGWVPTWEEATAVKPDEDELLPVILINGQFEVSPSVATEAERQNQANRILHDRLLAKARALALAAGNQFPDLAERARSVLDLLDLPFEQVNLFSVHLELEDLEDRRKMGSEDDLPFTDKVKLALSDVTRNGPGLTLGHPQVQILLDRRRIAREEQMPEAEAQAHQNLGRAVMDDATVHGPNIRKIEQEAEAILDRKVAAAVHNALHRNYTRQVAIVAATLTADMAINILANQFGVEIWAFVTANFTTLQAVAQTYGMAFATWFGQATDVVAQVIAANATIEPRPVPPKKR